MTAKKLILHVGLHKTGTTAIQQFLERRVPWLHDHGALYIPLSQMRTDVTDLINNIEEWKREAFQRFVGAQRAPAIILSDENIVGDSNDILSGQFYPWLAARLESIFTVPKPVKVELYIVIRELSKLLPSIYAEHIRHNDFVTFAAYCARFPLSEFSYFKHFAWLRDFKDRVGVHIVPFENEHGGGVAFAARDMLTTALGSLDGLDFGEFDRERVRPSFSAEEIELAATIAERTDGRIARQFLNNVDKFNKRFGKTRFDPFSDETKAMLTARYADDLARLRKAGLMSGGTDKPMARAAGKPRAK